MSESRLSQVNEPSQGWGGPWTEKKLEAFSKYVYSYLIIMRKHPFWKTIYFDGFAGSGSRSSTSSELFQQLQIAFDEERVYQGAAERVLQLPENLAFDFYYFIDKEIGALQKLELHLKSLPYPDEKRLVFKAGDANVFLHELGAALKKRNPSYAALVFLDPFGMQINWESIAALKGTRSDVWILVPTGVIVNRLLDRSGEIKHMEKLESFFGLTADEIRSAFYAMSTQQTLFGEETVTSKIEKPIEKIARLYVQRLKTIWKHVTEEPLRLNNTKGVPIFHFVFASNNANALKIAKDIIKPL